MIWKKYTSKVSRLIYLLTIVYLILLFASFLFVRYNAAGLLPLQDIEPHQHRYDSLESNYSILLRSQSKFDDSIFRKKNQFAILNSQKVKLFSDYKLKYIKYRRISYATYIKRDTVSAHSPESPLFAAVKKCKRSKLKYLKCRNEIIRLGNEINVLTDTSVKTRHLIELERKKLNEAKENLDKAIAKNKIIFDKESLFNNWQFAWIIFLSGIFVLPFIYYKLIVLRHDIKANFDRNYSFASEQRKQFSDDFFDHLESALQKYSSESFVAWRAFSFSVIKMLLVVLSITTAAIYYRFFSYLKELSTLALFALFLLLALTVVILIYRRYSMIGNKGLFTLKCMIGYEYLTNHILEKGEYGLYLRNFSAELDERSRSSEITKYEEIDYIINAVEKKLGLDFEDISFEELDGGSVAPQDTKEVRFNEIFFKHINILPFFYSANILDRRPTVDMIPVLVDNANGEDNWLLPICELIDNASIVIVYIKTKIGEGLAKELRYISDKRLYNKVVIIMEDPKMRFFNDKNFINKFPLQDVLEKCKSGELGELINLDVILYNRYNTTITVQW